jgi:hypothetical protein
MVRRMAEYEVLDVNAGARLATLRDRRGEYHVAEVVDEVPERDEWLHGSFDSLGFGLLSAPHSGQVYRLNLVAVRCDQASALDLLHPKITAPPVRGRDSDKPFTATPSPKDLWDGLALSPRA